MTEQIRLGIYYSCVNVCELMFCGGLQEQMFFFQEFPEYLLPAQNDTHCFPVHVFVHTCYI